MIETRQELSVRLQKLIDNGELPIVVYNSWVMNGGFAELTKELLLKELSDNYKLSFDKQRYIKYFTNKLVIMTNAMCRNSNMYTNLHEQLEIEAVSEFLKQNVN